MQKKPRKGGFFCPFLQIRSFNTVSIHARGVCVENFEGFLCSHFSGHVDAPCKLSFFQAFVCLVLPDTHSFLLIVLLQISVPGKNA
jgi:hypothetical protein